MKSIITTFITMISIQLVSAQKPFDTDLSKWMSIEHPEGRKYDDFLRLVGQSPHEWSVKKENGQVVPSIRQVVPNKIGEPPSFSTMMKLRSGTNAGSSYLKVDDGWIVGYTDWGTAIYWFNEKGTESQLLSDQYKIRFHFAFKDRHLVFEGKRTKTAFVSSGSVLELSKKNDQWGINPLFNLPGCPDLVLEESPGHYLVVTPRMLLRVNLDRKIEVLVPNAKWGWLFPNSIVRGDDGNIYIGMKQFIVKCGLADGIQDFEFLVPDESWLQKNN
jgi:hypothetical protein